MNLWGIDKPASIQLHGRWLCRHHYDYYSEIPEGLQYSPRRAALYALALEKVAPADTCNCAKGD